MIQTHSARIFLFAIVETLMKHSILIQDVQRVTVGVFDNDPTHKVRYYTCRVKLIFSSGRLAIVLKSNFACFVLYDYQFCICIRDAYIFNSVFCHIQSPFTIFENRVSVSIFLNTLRVFLSFITIYHISVVTRHKH